MAGANSCAVNMCFAFENIFRLKPGEQNKTVFPFLCWTHLPVSIACQKEQDGSIKPAMIVLEGALTILQAFHPSPCILRHCLHVVVRIVTDPWS